jgi:hypothetical protein
MASAAPKFRHEDEGTSLPWKTPEDLDAQVESEGYYQPEGTGVTICWLRLKNGQNIVGSALCKDIGDFNANTGQMQARKNTLRSAQIMVGIAPLSPAQYEQNLLHHGIIR